MRGVPLLVFSLVQTLLLSSSSGAEVPLRIVGKSSDSTARKSTLLPGSKTFTLSLRNESPQAIVAWRLACVYAKGNGNFATTSLEQDAFFQLENNTEVALRDRGIVSPGDVLDLTIPTHDGGERKSHLYEAVSCRVAAVIFADGSSAGDSQAIADLFERRSRIAADAQKAIDILSPMSAASLPDDSTKDLIEVLKAEISRGSWSSQILRQALEVSPVDGLSWPRARMTELLDEAREEYAVVEKHLPAPSRRETVLLKPSAVADPEQRWSTDPEAEGCQINGGSTGFGEERCPGSTSQVERLEFSVTAACRNPCTGETWSQNSPDYVTTGACPGCGAVFGKKGGIRRVSHDRLEYYTLGESKAYNQSGGSATCVRTTVKKAAVECHCPGCGNPSPILITMSDERYELTDAANGVRFDLNADGEAEQTAWTARGADEGFLALDRDLNGTIDDYMEIFGDHTPQLPSNEPNGWLALAVWDDTLNGGNEDGIIDVNDYIFTALQIWVDSNHNGYSEPDELSSLEAAGIEYLGLDYGRSERVDRFGNQFKFWANVGMASGRIVTAWDVFFVHL